MCSATLIAALSSSFAIIAPASPAALPAVTKAQIVTRARAALSRPPAPVPRLHTEGTLPGKGIRDMSIAAKRDHPIALDLAMAWKLTGEQAYRDGAANYLTAWAKTYHTYLNPIDDTGFDALLLAYDLVEPDLSASERTPIDRFWRGMAEGYLRAMEVGPKNSNTNWQSHRIKLATLAAFQSGDEVMIRRAHLAYRRQLAANLRSDGSTLDFEERDALHYVTYNLDPLLMAAIAAQAHGQDWYREAAPSGAALPRSLAWLATFALRERRHVEFAHSHIAFDRERAAAGQGEYAPHDWDPANSVNTFALAAILDRSFDNVRNELVRTSGGAPEPWIELLADAKPPYKFQR